MTDGLLLESLVVPIITDWSSRVNLLSVNVISTNLQTYVTGIHSRWTRFTNFHKILYIVNLVP